MKRLKIFAMAAIVLLSATAAGISPHTAKANATWQPEVLASSAQVRFEAQPTSYDATTNKYKYKFSWLMPRNRTYSFKIDGNLYNPRVTANGVAETPFWFSPDITYTIEVYPYANGRGPVLAKGSFRAPSVIAPVKALPVESALTFEQEIEVIDGYIANAAPYPKKSVADTAEKLKIMESFSGAAELDKFYELMPYLSAKSQEMLAKTPLFVKDLDAATEEANYENMVKDLRVTLYAGKQHATIKYKQKNLKTKKYETSELFFIKENGSWKIDFIEMLKSS